jgi:hypothetical protein
MRLFVDTGAEGLQSEGDAIIDDKPDIVAGACDPSTIEAGTAGEVFVSHFVEQVRRSYVLDPLAEWERVSRFS